VPISASRMFGSFTGNNWQTGNDWGAQLLDTVASQSIARLFSESESVNVQIRCNPPSKLLQGAIDSFKMEGRQLVIRRQFPVVEMSFETDAVAIDFSSVLAGQLKLKQPTQALARVVLSQTGLTQAFESDLVKCRLENLDLPNLPGEWAQSLVSFTQIQMELQPKAGVTISAIAQGIGCPDLPLRFTTQVCVKRRRKIEFESPQFHLEQVPEALREETQALAQAFLGLLNDMVDLDRFDLDGITMRLNRLETEGQNLIFAGYAQVDHFPRQDKSSV